jgi:hypothetical protein
VDYKKLYHAVYVDAQAIKAASKKGEGAVMDILTEAIDDGRKVLAREIEQSLWKSATGSRGVVGAAGTTTTTLPLSNANDAKYFEVGMVLQSAASESASVDTGTAIITGIDRAGGNLFSSSNWTAQITSLAAGRVLFRNGEKTLKAEGLLSHLPVTRTGTLTLQGVAVNTDWTRLGGVYQAAGGSSVATTIHNALALQANEGGQCDFVVVSHNKMRDLAQEIGQNRVIDAPKEGQFGFTGIKIYTPQGAVTVYGAKYCPDDYGFLINKEIEVVCQSKLVDIADLDGDALHLVYNADKYEIRLFSYYNLCVPNPLNCGLINFAA